MDKSRARIKLEQARYFIAQASKAKHDDRNTLVSSFEAAVVFARSVTLCLQKEYHDEPGFLDWYSGKQEEMKQNPLFGLFVEKRNYILKEGTSEVHKSINIEITEIISISDFVTCKVVRGRPWYRRSPKIIWEDMVSSVREPVREWRWKREMRKKSRRKAPASGSRVTESYFLDDPDWNGKDIFDLFDEYLGKLKSIVAEAESTFP